ncbi:unnamed protein product [Didymodactylos carnosus]|uniref:Autophagy-related protein 27 n=1 Tax=Didymodactylos carnosus TaxID=1234261 RepID=A0A814VQA6_9BILA|nr:unnamed protein product [Didymodactylos carnosus]CAF1191073.1 unnamed protein product [Didymodactylos carnosus]CAF3537114.1 unnamed protein product [Didymodactylos carnosus]CAF3955368.1 unnamed protein product [Didymodactylos carnosus]
MYSFLLLLLLLVHRHLIINGDKMASCQQTFGSSKYDLNSLNTFTLTGSDQEYNYAFTPCGIVPQTSCGGRMVNGVMACQTSKTQSFVAVIAYTDGSKPTNATYTKDAKGIVMTTINGDTCGPRRTMTATFICDKNIKKPTTMEVHEPRPPGCTFNIIVKAAGACPIGSSGGGLSGGAIFVIILIVLIVVYLVGGLLFKRFKQNQTGIAAIPNLDFWLLLPTLIRGGLGFTWSKIRGVCGGGSTSASSSYQSV